MLTITRPTAARSAVRATAARLRYYGDVNLNGSTVNGNSITGASSVYGGGIYSSDASVSLVNSHVDNNKGTAFLNASSTTGYGGGIYAYASVSLTGSTANGNSLVTPANPVVTFQATFASGSTSITVVGSTAGLAVGQTISGAGAAGSKITAITGNTLTIAPATTAANTGTSETLTCRLRRAVTSTAAVSTATRAA